MPGNTGECHARYAGSQTKLHKDDKEFLCLIELQKWRPHKLERVWKPKMLDQNAAWVLSMPMFLNMTLATLPL